MRVLTLLARLGFACAAVMLAGGAEALGADGDGWIALTGPQEFEAFLSPTGTWQVGGGAKINPENPKLLVPESGAGVIVNGPLGRTNNLLTKEKFGAIESHFEFMVPKGSNSGVKFEGLYEIQIADSWGVADATASHCGGIYPRAELLPRYRHIDKGYPPKVNASRPPGEWQTLDITFVPPKFGPDGKKVEDACFVKVVLNGKVVHENQKVPCPTGHAWTIPEIATGPLMIQADHGPVAFRNVRVRPYTAK